MNTQEITFIDGWDYLDFAWFLDRYDPTKQAEYNDIKPIHDFYSDLVVSFGDGENIRNYLADQLRKPVLKCPCCHKLFNVYAFPYQVNDNFSLTFCSYTCSEKYTVQNLQILIADGMSFKEIAEGI